MFKWILTKVQAQFNGGKRAIPKHGAGGTWKGTL